MIIIGIDPGSRVTGFGLIETDGNKHKYIASGCIRLLHKNFPERLKEIFTNLTQVIDTYKPDRAAIEEVFLRDNPNTALKLGQARGAAITALVNRELTVAEYAARKIKQAVVGYGAADKKQVSFMVKSILKIAGILQEDAADALAIALYDAYLLKTIK